MELKTKRLRIVPLNAEQMSLLCERRDKLDAALRLAPSRSDADEHLKSAYREMYAQCLAEPKNHLWHTNWQIVLNSENRSIGSIGFLNTPNNNNEVEIGYGIDQAYRNQGYASEALDALCKWAFEKGVYFIQAQSEPNNESSKRVLEKCGFKRVGSDDNGFNFELEKPASTWLSVYMCLGMSCGLCIGAAFENIPVGMCIGLAIGVGIGALLDADDKKHRKRH